MKIQEIIENLTLEEKLTQMFIVGYKGDKPFNSPNFEYLINKKLGGVIFFSQNILSEEQIRNTVEEINQKAKIPLFMSIDQEGGRVERTENIHNGKKYLSAKYIKEKGIRETIKQTEDISKELVSYGINMNFAPVLDVNTNDKNPIIGERAYSNQPEEIIEYGIKVQETYIKNGVIPVAKHFPGHGAASKDSHISLPCIDIPFEELEKIHIKPFKEAIKANVPAIMVAHVHYPCFNKEELPASISKEVINDYLLKKLGFNGLVISDDMVMGAIKEMPLIESVTRGINAGITMFIFREATDEIPQLIKELESKIALGELDENIINKNVEKILKIKEKYCTNNYLFVL